MGLQNICTDRKVILTGLFFVYTAHKTVAQSLFQNGIFAVFTATHNFRWCKTAQFRCNCLGIFAQSGVERTGGKVTEGNAEFAPLAVVRSEIIILPLFQHTAFRNGAGGDDPGDIPFHNALGLGGIFHLLANSHLVALCHQTGNVSIHRMVRHTAHRGLLFLGLVSIPGGQGQIKFPGSGLGIFIKHFVEVTKAEEQDTILIALFDLEILPTHRRHFIGRCSHKINSLYLYSGSLPVRLQVVAPVMVISVNVPIKLSSPEKRTNLPPSVRAVSRSLSLPSTRQRSVFPT